eukprot:TRINITY_DN189_c0_g1_i1.p1 TRINITY_DN189_c0_g1~~TRINITY_DN189_c0_g1_i1.p1  ORF type:complete len:466 (+),score=45.44 TRINITY_DN189_c0_g1_i1:71-1468(+)
MIAKFLSFVLLLVLFFQFSASQDVIYISGNCTGLVNSTYVCSLQDAIDNATSRKLNEIHICLIDSEPINGAFSFLNLEKWTIDILNISSCGTTNDVSLLWNYLDRNEQPVEIQSLIFNHVNLIFSGNYIFSTSLTVNVNNITLTNVTVNPVALELNTYFLFWSSYIHVYGSRFLGFTRFYSTLMDISRSVFLANVHFVISYPDSSSVILVSDSEFQDINSLYKSPAIYIEATGKTIFSHCQFRNLTGGILIKPQDSFHLVLDDLFFEDIVSLSSSYFYISDELSPTVHLLVTNNLFGCPRRPNGDLIRVFQTSFSSFSITNSSVETSCQIPWNNPGYKCNPLGPCTQCQAGTYSTDNNCLTCPPLTFNPIPGATVCNQCQGNSISSDNRTVCIYCMNARATPNNTCIDYVTPTKVPEKENSSYLILLIVVNVVFAFLVILVAGIAWKTRESPHTKEGDPLLTTRG